MTDSILLKDKLECAFAGIGEQVGSLIRCMVQQEIAAHASRIQELNTMLLGTACETSSGQVPSGDLSAA